MRGTEEKLEHVAAGRGLSYVPRSETVFHSRPDISYVPVPELTHDHVCLAVATSHSSALVDDFAAAVRATAGTTAECGTLNAVG